MTEEQQPRVPGMRDVPRNLQPYFLGLLFRGPRWNEIEGEEASSLLAQHLAYLRAQMESRTYLFAGPATGGEEIVGVLMMQAEDVDTARAIAAGDPGVQAGRLRVEVHPVLLPSLEGVRVSY